MYLYYATSLCLNHKKCPIFLFNFSKKEWPRQYKISKENIAKVTTKHDNKEDLTNGERRILLETIYNDVTKYKGGMLVHVFNISKVIIHCKNSLHKKNLQYTCIFHFAKNCIT